MSKFTEWTNAAGLNHGSEHNEARRSECRNVRGNKVLRTSGMAPRTEWLPVAISGET